MKMNILKNLLFSILLLSLYACGGETDAVESGTYTGTIDEVNPEETEIYVVTEDDKRLELYFTENTELTRGGEVVAFDALEVGQPVEVTVERVGNRLDPVSVVIVE